MIEKFRLNRVKSEKKSEFDLTPISVSWTYEGKKYKRENTRDRIIAKLSKDKAAIAVIEAPYNYAENRAYVLNPENEIIWDISFMLHKLYQPFDVLSFYDIYYADGLLTFFFNYNNKADFRFSFDEKTGKMGKIIESR